MTINGVIAGRNLGKSQIILKADKQEKIVEILERFKESSNIQEVFDRIINPDGHLKRQPGINWFGLVHRLNTRSEIHGLRELHKNITGVNPKSWQELRNFFDTYYATSNLPNKIPDYNIDNSEEYFNEYINCHPEIKDNSKFVVDESKETVEKVDYLDLPVEIMEVIYNELDVSGASKLSQTSGYNNSIFADNRFWQAKLDAVYGIDISQQKEILKENESPQYLFKSISIAFKGFKDKFLIKFQIADFIFLIRQYKNNKDKYTIQEALKILKKRYEECPTSPGLLCTGIAGINLNVNKVKSLVTFENLCIRTLMISENLDHKGAIFRYNNFNNRLKNYIAAGLSPTDIEKFESQYHYSDLKEKYKYSKNKIEIYLKYFPKLDILDFAAIQFFEDIHERAIAKLVSKGKTPKEAIKQLERLGELEVKEIISGITLPRLMHTDGVSERENLLLVKGTKFLERKYKSESRNPL